MLCISENYLIVCILMTNWNSKSGGWVGFSRKLRGKYISVCLSVCQLLSLVVTKKWELKLLWHYLTIFSLPNSPTLLFKFLITKRLIKKVESGASNVVSISTYAYVNWLFRRIETNFFSKSSFHSDINYIFSKTRSCEADIKFKAHWLAAPSCIKYVCLSESTLRWKKHTNLCLWTPNFKQTQFLINSPPPT